MAQAHCAQWKCKYVVSIPVHVQCLLCVNVQSLDKYKHVAIGL